MLFGSWRSAYSPHAGQGGQSSGWSIGTGSVASGSAGALPSRALGATPTRPFDSSTVKRRSHT